MWRSELLSQLVNVCDMNVALRNCQTVCGSLEAFLTALLHTLTVVMQQYLTSNMTYYHGNQMLRKGSIYIYVS